MDHLSININICLLSHWTLRATAGVSQIPVPDNQLKLVHWYRIEDTLPSGCHPASVILSPLGLANCCIPELAGFLARLAWLFSCRYAVPSEGS